jgi:hypothetical protein
VARTRLTGVGSTGRENSPGGIEKGEEIDEEVPTVLPLFLLMSHHLQEHLERLGVHH